MNRKQKSYSNAAGFTLVEVLASIVIISIILGGVLQLITFTNKTAVSNNYKLVTTHLAKASVERIKIQPHAFFPIDEIGHATQLYSFNNCKIKNCKELYQFNVNDLMYDVTLKVSQNLDEKQLDLINIVVTVEQVEEKLNSTVEGYVVIDEKYEE